MKQTGTCPKCGSKNVLKGMEVAGSRNVGIRLLAPEKPEAMLVFQGRPASEVAACVCPECGFVEFYAVDPKELQPSDP